MATNEGSVEVAGVDLAGQNHVCAFFKTMDEDIGCFARSTKAVSTGVKRLLTS
jgi:hypothetical protein